VPESACCWPLRPVRHRIAIGYISSSGQGGAKLNRRKYGELIENLAASFPYWMAGNYVKYTGRWDTLPVDSHELIALCAPRPVFLSAGNGPGPVAADGTFQANDAWIDGKGSFLAAVGAGPVYRLLGKKDLGTTESHPGADLADLHYLRGALLPETGGHAPAELTGSDDPTPIGGLSADRDDPRVAFCPASRAAVWIAIRALSLLGAGEVMEQCRPDLQVGRAGFRETAPNRCC